MSRGGEYSTRPELLNPAAYPKYRFVYNDGRGRAATTKAFTGLTGTLFQGVRLCGIVQQVHRARPTLAASEDEQIPVFLLTSVPTDLPVDDLVTLDELTAPLRAFVPVPGCALDLADVLLDVADGDAPDGFRPESLIERTDDGIQFRKKQIARLARVAGITGPSGDPITDRSISTYVNELADLGVLDVGEYEQRAGRPYTADFSTLKHLSQVIHCDAGFEVAIKRRLRRLAAEPHSGLRWLRWAREALGLAGDRCMIPRGGDPPPIDAD